MGLIWIAGAIVWAAAEAIFFFIVPDVWLTAAVVKFGFTKSILLAALAALAASLAGLLMWRWGHTDPAQARSFVLAVPAIGPDLLTRARHAVAGDWLAGMTFGAISGVPYKLYAVEAGARGLAPLQFLAGSLLARACRFALTMTITGVISRFMIHTGQARWRPALLGFTWGVVYATYFTIRLRHGA